MQANDLRDVYSHYAQELGSRCNTLALSGLAAIWVFNSPTVSGPVLPRDLLLPGVFFVLALALDMLQYAYGVIVWGLLVRKSENQSHGELLLPPPLKWPSGICFYGKFVSVTVGYGIFLLSLSHRFGV